VMVSFCRDRRDWSFVREGEAVAGGSLRRRGEGEGGCFAGGFLRCRDGGARFELCGL
jgi:hypothetical protein